MNQNHKSFSFSLRQIKNQIKNQILYIRKPLKSQLQSLTRDLKYLEVQRLLTSKWD